MDFCVHGTQRFGHDSTYLSFQTRVRVPALLSAAVVASRSVPALFPPPFMAYGRGRSGAGAGAGPGLGLGPGHAGTASSAPTSPGASPSPSPGTEPRGQQHRPGPDPARQPLLGQHATWRLDEEPETAV